MAQAADMQADAGERPICGVDVVLAATAAIAVNIAAGFAIVIGLIVWTISQGRQISGFEMLQTDFGLIIGLTTATDAAILVLLWLIARRFSARPWRRFFAPVRLGTVGWAVLSTAMLMAAGSGTEWLLQNYFGIVAVPSAAEAAITPKTLGQLAIVLGCLALFAPFFEEVLFRGFLFGWLKRVTPVWVAVIVSAAVFSLMHLLFLTRGGASGIIGTVEIFLLGALAAAWTAHSKSLWPAYAVHVFNNAAVFALAFLLPDL